jgi:uncharacterized protein
MSPFAVLARHLEPASEIYGCLVVHSVLVARKARRIAEEYLDRHPEASVDLEFLTEAALLHDIGVKACRSSKLPTTGDEPYVRHGVIGREILDAEGLPRHALVCERHTGAGITREEVIRLDLPIPPRDYLPVSLEEKIICVADKFFSKTPGKLWRKEKPEKVERSLLKHGPDVLSRWRALCREVLES